MKGKNLLVPCLLFALTVGIFVISGCVQEVSISDVLNNPDQYYEKEITVRGYVKELGAFKSASGDETGRECQCFALTSEQTLGEYVAVPEKTINEVWYAWHEPYSRVDVSGIHNNDLVIVTGTFIESAGKGIIVLKEIKKV